MKFKRKNFLSLVLAGILFMAVPAESATFSLDLGNCIAWAQRSVSALFSSKSFRKFAPALAVAGIAVIGGALWYRSKKKGVFNQQFDENFDVPGGQADLGTSNENNEQVAERANVKVRSAQGTGLADCLSEIEEEEIECKESENVAQERAEIDFIEQVIMSKDEQQSKVDAEQQMDRIYLASDSVVINGELVAGRGYQPSEDVVVQQLAVLHQDTEKEITGKPVFIGGGKASCGYHAIKNAFIYSNWDNIEESLNSTDLVQEICANSDDAIIGSWRQDIISRRKRGKTPGEWLKEDAEEKQGEWIDGNEISMLINRNKLFGHEDYLTVSDINELTKYPLPQEEIKNIQQKNIQIFFVNTGRIENNREIRGHWFTLVLENKYGKRVWTIIDSKNIVRLYNDTWVKEIIKIFDPEKNISDKLIIPHDQAVKIKNGINNLLVVNYMNAEEKIKKLLVLERWYKDWSGKPLPVNLQWKINNVFSDEN